MAEAALDDVFIDDISFPAADRYLLGAPGWSGLGEDLPKGVFEQWVSWVMSKRYLFDDPELGGLKNASTPC